MQNLIWIIKTSQWQETELLRVTVVTDVVSATRTEVFGGPVTTVLVGHLLLSAVLWTMILFFLELCSRGRDGEIYLFANGSSQGII